ncbi:MAG: hypothetical protein AAFR98_11595 [Pseudomonadota bacterium]
MTLTIASMPDVNPATADGFGLITIAACLFVLTEYGFSQPALLEFRFAPPYNRWRFFSLITIMLALVVLCGTVKFSSPLNTLTLMAADFAVSVFDFPGSPSLIMRGLLESEVTQKAAEMIVPMASLGYLISVVSFVGFFIYLLRSPWPAQEDAFHFWSNLPTFQTVLPENARDRLLQIGLLSIAMAVVFPFAIPFFLKSFSDLLPIRSFVGDFTLFWIIAFSTWLPLACAMRGFSLLKVSRMIEYDSQKEPA